MDKNRAATQFKAAQAAVFAPGQFPEFDPRPGTIVAPPDGEPWCLVRPLGEGGHGQVWLGFALETTADISVPELRARLPQIPNGGAIFQCDPKTVEGLAALAEGGLLGALKFLSPAVLGSAHGQEMVERLMQEAKVCTIGAPQIPQLLAARREPFAFVVMEFVHGENLEEYLRRYYDQMGHLPWELIEIVGQDMFDAVTVLHGEGILHRDLKFSNFMMASAARHARRVLKLLDFGLAKFVGQVESGAAGAGRRAGLVETVAQSPLMGTPAFMAPEQHLAPGKQPRTPATDLYALGCMLFEMVTGQEWLPWSEDLRNMSDGRSYQEAIASPVPDLQDRPYLKRRPQTAQLLRSFLSWLLDPDWRRRPQSIEEALGGAAGAPGFSNIRRAYHDEVKG